MNTMENNPTSLRCPGREAMKDPVTDPGASEKRSFPDEHSRNETIHFTTRPNASEHQLNPNRTRASTLLGQSSTQQIYHTNDQGHPWCPPIHHINSSTSVPPPFAAMEAPSISFQHSMHRGTAYPPPNNMTSNGSSGQLGSSADTGGGHDEPRGQTVTRPERVQQSSHDEMLRRPLFVPRYCPWERSSIVLDVNNVDLNALSSNLVEAFRGLNLHVKYLGDPVSAAALSTENVELYLSLWMTHDGKHISVEVQRCRGDSVAFHRCSNCILQAAAGKSSEAMGFSQPRAPRSDTPHGGDDGYVKAATREKSPHRIETTLDYNRPSACSGDAGGNVGRLNKARKSPRRSGSTKPKSSSSVAEFAKLSPMGRPGSLKPSTSSDSLEYLLDLVASDNETSDDGEVSSQHDDSSERAAAPEQSRVEEQPRKTSVVVRHIINRDESNYVDEVQDHDVLCGKGGRINHHPGNRRYRNIVNEWKAKYQGMDLTKAAKTQMSHDIVRLVTKDGARFLKMDSTINRFYVLSEESARKKTVQALREKKKYKWTYPKPSPWFQPWQLDGSHNKM